MAPGLVADLGGYYDYWSTGSRATLRELLVNEDRGTRRPGGRAGIRLRRLLRLPPPSIPPPP